MGRPKKKADAPVENKLKEEAIETVKTQVEQTPAEETVIENKYPGHTTRAFRG